VRWEGWSGTDSSGAVVTDAAMVLLVPVTAVQRTSPFIPLSPLLPVFAHLFPPFEHRWGIDCTFPSAAGPVASAKGSQGRSATPPSRAAKVSAAAAIASAAQAAPAAPAAPVVASATPDVAEQCVFSSLTFPFSLYSCTILILLETQTSTDERPTRIDGSCTRPCPERRHYFLPLPARLSTRRHSPSLFPQPLSQRSRPTARLFLSERERFLPS
jgi:hypothetical protein